MDVGNERNQVLLREGREGRHDCLVLREKFGCGAVAGFHLFRRILNKGGDPLKRLMVGYMAQLRGNIVVIEIVTR